MSDSEDSHGLPSVAETDSYGIGLGLDRESLPSAKPGSNKRRSCQITACTRLFKASRGGSLDYHTAVARAGVRIGPSTPLEFAQWPDDVVQRLFSDDMAHGPARRGRYEALVQQGHILHTDFSGQGCVEMCLQMAEVAAREAGMTLPSQLLSLHRACDSHPLCQKILKSFKPLHLFCDVADRVAGGHRDSLRAMRPELTAKGNPKDHEDACTKYNKMKGFLAQQGAAIFGPGKVSQGCLMHPGMACLVAAPESSSPHVPLRTSVAGTMCTPWTKLGKGTGSGHPANESHHIWTEDAKRSDMDMVTLENSEFFPFNVWQDHMCPEWMTVHICVCPSMLGWPCRRMRMYATAINLKRMVWLGPVDPKQVMTDFLKLFARTVNEEADAFAFLDTEARREDLHHAMVLARGVHSGNVAVMNAMSPDTRVRLFDYEKMQEKAVGLGGSCVADLSQTASRGRLGPWFGAFARSSRFCSLTAIPKGSDNYPYVFTPAEVAFVNGWPSIGSVKGTEMPFTKCMPEALQNLSMRDCASVMGNGMHLHTMCAWLLYVQAHCVRRETLQSWWPLKEHSLAQEAVPQDNDARL